MYFSTSLKTSTALSMSRMHIVSTCIITTRYMAMPFSTSNAATRFLVVVIVFGLLGAKLLLNCHFSKKQQWNRRK